MLQIEILLKRLTLDVFLLEVFVGASDRFWFEVWVIDKTILPQKVPYVERAEEEINKSNPVICNYVNIKEYIPAVWSIELSNCMTYEDWILNGMKCKNDRGPV